MKLMYLLFLCFVLGGCAHSNVSKNLPYLKGKTSAQVASAFGRPTVVHREENATLWSYYQNNCSSLIFFDTQEVVQYAELRGECAVSFAKK